MSFADIEKAIIHYAEKAKAGTISLEDMVRVLLLPMVVFTALCFQLRSSIRPKVVSWNACDSGRPVVRNGEIIIKPMMYLALSYDHRVVDGKKRLPFWSKSKRPSRNLHASLGI